MYLQKSIQGAAWVRETENTRSNDITHSHGSGDSDAVWRPLYLVEAYDVDHPGTEPRGGRGFLPYELGVELRVAQVLFSHTPHGGLRDVLLVKVHQSLQEVIHLDVRVN